MKRPSKLAAALAAVFSAGMLAVPGTVSADIFQWQYINPADPTQGKQPSTTLCLGGAGVNAVPYADLSSRNLTTAYLIEADLSNARFNSATLTNADFSHANLTNAVFAGPFSFVLAANLTSANFDHANLTNADLGGAALTSANLTAAQVLGASFYSTTSSGFTGAQLYSTASYQNHDLTGINLSANNLSGWSFAGQNLTNAKLTGGDLTSANFTGAQVRAASLSGLGFIAAQLYSTASYQNHDLSGIALGSNNLSGWNFAGQNLTNASFSQATLTSADFTAAQVRGAHFDGTIGFTAAQLYSTASYQSHDLAGINLQQNNLSGWNLAGQNLTNAYFAGATLTNTNFTAAEVRGADFQGATYGGFTAAQLYSTASYQNHDLSGINLGNSNLSGWNFAGQNLTNTDFYYATLTGVNFNHANLTNAGLARAGVTNADFTGAQVRGAYLPGLTAAQLYSTTSYQNHDLSGSGFGGDYSGVNFSGQKLTNAGFFDAVLAQTDFSHANLTNASFSYLGDEGNATIGDNLGGANFSYANLTNANLTGCTLSGANFTGAQVQGASFAQVNPGYGFWTDSISAVQLYSTASYQNHDLAGIRILAVSLSGWNFAGQNLTNAYIYSIYGDPGIFTAADTRGAQLSSLGSSTANLIRPDGHVAGLHLTAGQSLLVRNYHGNPQASPNPGPIPIRIDQSMAMDPTGALRLMLDGDHWDSRISFAPGIPVALGGGTLDLSFAAGIDITAQIGRSFDIFDWTGVTPAGSFNLSSQYAWDVSKLYTSGQVTLVPRIGDLNLDGQVTIADFIDLASHFNNPGTWREGDLNYDGQVTIADFIDLASNFNSNYAGQTGAITPQDEQTLSSFAASVPEPGSLALLGVAGIAPLLGRRINRQGGKPKQGR